MVVAVDKQVVTFGKRPEHARDWRKPLLRNLQVKIGVAIRHGGFLFVDRNSERQNDCVRYYLTAGREWTAPRRQWRTCTTRSLPVSQRTYVEMRGPAFWVVGYRGARMMGS